MQKKIIALAVAGLASTAAFAQTNVQIYGIADAAYIYTNVNGGTTNNNGNATAGNGTEAHGRDTHSIQSGQLAGSRIGFKGTEDLGNGLKAVFVLEYSLDLDQNTGVGSGISGLFARQQFVGLSGKSGDVTLGRQYAPGYFTTTMDPTASSPALSSVDASQAFLGATIRTASAARWNNSVSFKSANYGGFSAHIVRGMGEVANEMERGASTGIGADYVNGALAVKYVYHRATTPTTANVSFVNGYQDEHYVGVSFDAKVVKLMGAVQTVDQGGIANAQGPIANGGQGRAASGVAYQFGAVVPVGKGNIHASYAYADRSGANTANLQLGNALRGDISSINVAYTHGLSKRTTLYTGLRYTDTDTTNGGSVLTAFGAGINHAF